MNNIFGGSKEVQKEEGDSNNLAMGYFYLVDIIHFTLEKKSKQKKIEIEK